MSADNEMDSGVRSLLEQIDLLEKESNDYLSELEVWQSEIHQSAKVIQRLLSRSTFRRQMTQKTNRRMKRALRFWAMNRRNVRALGVLIRRYKR
jgi:hypothetical protein